MEKYPLHKVKTRQAEIAYFDEGSWPVIICVHGFPDNADVWHPVMRVLLRSWYRVIAPYMRGYAPSSFASDNYYGIDAHGEDVISLMDAIGIQSAHLVWVDWWAMACQMAAIDEPKRFKTITMCALPPLRSFWRLLYSKILYLPIQLRNSSYILFFIIPWLAERILRCNDFFLTHVFRKYLSAWWDDDPVSTKDLKQTFWNGHFTAALQTYRHTLLPWNAHKKLYRNLKKKVKVPALFVVGKKDRCFYWKLFSGLEEYFSDWVRIEVLNDTGHFIPSEQPDKLANLILSHVSSDRWYAIMDESQKGSIKKSRTVKIGKDNLVYELEIKKFIDLEVFFLNVLLFILISIFAYWYLDWLLFFLLLYGIVMRIFVANHDRFHADTSIHLPRLLEKMTENITVVFTPWDESYASIRMKHLLHHSTHHYGSSSVLDTKTDPHSIYEMWHPIRIFFACLFYEEVQLFFDIRDNKPLKSRLYRAIVSVPLQIGFIVLFGFKVYILVVLAMRITGFVAWFIFSWGLHNQFPYRFGFSAHIKKVIKFLFVLVHGRRVTAACLYHATHHAWPSIPYNQLYRFDAIAYQNIDVAPRMNPTR